MSWSFWAFIITFIIAWLTMGMLAFFLYWLASPILLIKYPLMNKWEGDWVWPSAVLVSIFWSFGFLIAGAVNYFLQNQSWVANWLELIYIFILWFWAVFCWLIVLKFNYKLS